MPSLGRGEKVAERIKGITVEINGDTTGLDKALKGVNSQIIDSQAELKKVQRLLKLDPTNTELLAQKQQLLAQKAQATAEKYETLKTALEQATDLGEEQLRALQRETIEAGERAEKAAEEYKAFSPVLEELGGKADKLSTAFGEVADKTKGLSAAAAGGLAALGGLALKAAGAADDLNTLSKQSGFSTDTLQKWTYAADLVDVSVDDIIGSARKLEKNMGSTSAEVVNAWNQLGVGVRNVDGSFRDVEYVFNDTLMALSMVTDEVERDQLAMTLFGRSANDLAGIVDDGGEALRALGEEAEQAGLILSEDALAKANQFNDGIDRLKAIANDAFIEAGATLAETFLPALGNLVEKISDVLKWFGNLNQGQLKLLGTILLVVAAINPIARTVSNVSGAISGVTKAATLFNTVAGDPVYMTFFKWAAIIIAVVAAVTALIAAISVLTGKGKDLKNAMGAVGNVSAPKIVGGVPMMASGGVLSSGSAIVGEAGPELLTMAGGRAVVQPLTATLDSAGLADALKGVGGGDVMVNVNFGGSLAQLGRLLQPHVTAETARRGPSFSGR